ncbi:C6 finger domain protein [Fusarium beomiforme]|uniref:C6 finger domain protein n=1 Tax=Fusarium beomiforme TaxID=44412 RepID=A0A9P5A729_9HYPO|nr:C6 finger domain protein [Fusarium beomiforme]
MSACIDTGMPELGTYWAGELEFFGSPKCMLPSIGPPNANLDAAAVSEMATIYGQSRPGMENALVDTAALWKAPLTNSDGSSDILTQADENIHINSLWLTPEVSEPKPTLRVFGKIMQPPAAMLMGGIKKWRHLQQYLVNLASQNDAVMNALSCLDKLLEWDSVSDSTTPTDQLHEHIQTSCNSVTRLIQESLCLIPCDGNPKMDEWLAATFLLAWIQVLRDHVQHDNESLFPTELADTIITCSYDWNWYSKQLLSWFNSLDSKASHLSGPALLSPKALKVVSRYPIQIISCDYEESRYRSDSFDASQDLSEISSSPLSGVSEHGDSGIVVPARSPCDVKEMVLRAILQPAAEWYLETQAYCREISALDKHHRERFTPDAEIQVALEGKHIHSKLWDLWAQCPSVITLSSAELSQSVAPDVATRVNEVSDIYLASFWILFVYLHRVCWWHLPHTAAVSRAMEKTWDHMKTSYGEADNNNSQQKTVHPALMWPVFLFGAECKDEERRRWAIEQLKALGRARPVLKSEKQNRETLPAFRISHGATKNAKRAALLLEALIQKQDETKCRADDRDLAMEMFNCYFSIV